MLLQYTVLSSSLMFKILRLLLATYVFVLGLTLPTHQVASLDNDHRNHECAVCFTQSALDAGLQLANVDAVSTQHVFLTPLSFATELAQRDETIFVEPAARGPPLS